MAVPQAEPWTAVHDTPNKSPRMNVGRKGVCLHGAAMTSLDGLRRLAMGAKQVSATAIGKDAAAEKMMGDGYRAWSLSSALYDSLFRTVEECNDSVDGWTFSDESHWALARMVAYWAWVDGFWPHRDGDPKSWTVIGHREVYTIYGASYATACPQAMNLGLVTRRAQELLLGMHGGIEPEPLPPWALSEKEMEMLFLIKINDGASKYGGGTIHAVTGPGYWVEVRTADAANTLAKRFGDAANLTYAEWDAFKAAAAASGYEPAPSIVS